MFISKKYLPNMLYKAAFYTFFLSLCLIAVRDLTIEFFALPAENNFLVPAGKVLEPEKESFSFAVMSDTGAQNGPLEEILRRAGKDGKNAFMLHLGDLIRYRNISHYRWLINEMDEEASLLPFYIIPGNHEVANRFGRVDKSAYKAAFGQPYYWFSYGNTMFIALDSSEGEYSRIQLDWLEDILEKIRPHYKNCIIYSHIPPVNSDNWKKKINITPSFSKLKQIISDKNITLFLSGHIHHYDNKNMDGIPLLTLMPSGQPPRSAPHKFGYVVIDINENGVNQITPYYLESDYKHANEYVEMFFSSVFVDDRSLIVIFSGMGLSLLLAIAAFILQRCCKPGGKRF